MWNSKKQFMTMKYFKYSVSALLMSFALTSCNDYFDIKPSTYIPADNVWNDPAVVNSILGQLYHNIQYEEFKYAEGFFDFNTVTLAICSDEATTAWGGDFSHNEVSDIDFGDSWFYTYGDAYKEIRNCNTFLRQITDASVDENEKKSIEGEVRFIRAMHYFTLVKRLGGVPLITTVQEYNDSDDLTKLQVPRNQEEEIWEFIRKECFEIADMLPETREDKYRNRVTKYTAYALASRASLYAASIAKYGKVDKGHCVGVDPAKADYYWEQAALAATKVTESGKYELVGYHLSTPEERTKSYRSFFLDDSNKEFIWMKSYVEPDIMHNYTKMCAPFSFRRGFGYGCSESPNLELVEAFEYINDYDGSLKVTDESGKLIEYAHLNDIFKNKDPRLAATVGLPGGNFQEGIIEVRRGVSKGGKIPSINDSKEFPHSMSEKYKLSDGNEITTIGKDGPYEDKEPTKTGFYLLKFIDESLVDYNRCTNPWPMFRLAEMYLNLAVAEIELGHVKEALKAVNMIRHRAGIHEIEENEVTQHGGNDWLRDRIRNERRVELAYEAHRFWDLRRWRITATPRSDNGGTGVMDSYKATGLYPWAVYEAGAAKDEKTGLMTPKKYVFSKEESDGQRLKRARKHFYQKNYYMKIKDEDMKTNPKLVNNPEF